MSDLATLLLVEPDEGVVALFRATLELECRCRILVASDAEIGLRMAHDDLPDLVVVSHAGAGLNGLALCQQIKRDPRLADTMVVLLVEPSANDVRLAGLTFGVDEYLTRPPHPAEILTKLHTMSRLRQVHVKLRQDKFELDELHEHMRSRFSQLLALLGEMLDMRLPGSADRGARIAELGLQVAARFDVPEIHLRDLEIAARLHEMGRMLQSDGSNPEARLQQQGVDDWQYIIATRALLEKVPGLEGAAELVGALHENWDGTGHPDHLLQGQIPLRSRILRVVVDLFAALAHTDPSAMDALLDDMQAHVGTRYDPMVLIHLRSVLQGVDGRDVQGDRRVLPVTELEVGMVLAEDLLTPSGLKLLARETQLTQATLDVIQRRHSLEPIVQGAVVLRA